MSKQRNGPEMEWWVEYWGWYRTPPQWEFWSTHDTKAEAMADAERQLARSGARWRVVEIARWPVKVFV